MVLPWLAATANRLKATRLAAYLDAMMVEENCANRRVRVCRTGEFRWMIFAASMTAARAQVESMEHQAAMVSFTLATNCLSVKGFARKSNCWPSAGRCF